ncbi:transmembrane emp24 domain-containing protein p24delta3-like [Olea europaea var. sylvestris]|uniref:Transmembrane emp24 domain-containing p24delta3-like n=1 Tax=Olea europaea subsp. europaea TaxID=158383 RepID=A0A8S0RUJ5_OLEEU|nr:transmembrane emp24 domain-containing protein p24delta3-like [Olea europaea var. sylvestris]CAA2983053.1 transmembrane emp24 domain-containing p24delta3-like [Olea europaea subsp. europaea]
MKSVEVCLLGVVLIVVGLVVPVARGIWLDVPSSGTKCVSEELHSKVVVLADFFVVGDEHHINNSIVPTISVKVTSPYGNNLYHQENVTHGQFAFTTTESGNYLACFWIDNSHQGDRSMSVGLEWKTGITAKDWDSVAKKEKIDGLELELQKLEGAVEAIHENLIYLKDREAEMREVSEKTNARVAWLSILSLGVCIVVSIFQLLYLKRYFQKKKLI